MDVSQILYPYLDRIGYKNGPEQLLSDPLSSLLLRTSMGGSMAKVRVRARLEPRSVEPNT